MKSGKTFLAFLFLAMVVSALVIHSTRGQIPQPQQQNPVPGQRPSDDSLPPMPNADKKILENNDKDMKKKVERLYQLASELKEEVQKTDSSKVLSLNLMRKAEEIEKLAHDIKNRSKG